MTAPRLKRIPRRERGFTLLEVMVATVIFIVGFAGVVYLNAAAIDYTRLSSDISLGSNLAANTLEELRVADYAAMSAEMIFFDQSGAQLSRIPYAEGATPPADTFFTVTTTVTEDPNGFFKDVEAAVSWHYAKEYRHEVSMQSRMLLE